MKRLHAILCISFIVVPFAGCGELDANKITGTISVMDQDGNRIENPEVLLRYTYTERQSLSKGELAGSRFLEANKAGIYEFEIRAYSASIEVNADGFWWGRIGTSGAPTDTHLVPGTTNTYRYDFDVVLQRAINPRPLFVHSTFTPRVIPELNMEYGYDLERGDWVRPHGRGNRVDLIFSATGDVEENGNYEITIRLRFPNEHDGILPVQRSPERQHSHLLLGQEAPVEGYLPIWQMRIQRTWKEDYPIFHSEPPAEHARQFVGYWFRVHTEVDSETGEIVRARYGKMSSDFRLGLHRIRESNEIRGSVKFQYLYAPDHSRSVEWDGTNTLVPGGNIQGMHQLR